MSQEERNRKLRHVKKGEDRRRTVIDREERREAHRDMFEHKSR